MAYTAANLNLVSVAPLGIAGQLWTHFSADAAAVVDTSGFISNGGSYGIRVTDIVQHRDTSTGIITSHRVVSVAAAGGVDLADGVVIASATNTD